MDRDESIIWLEEMINSPVKASDCRLYFAGNWICRTTPDGIEVNAKVPLWAKIKSIPIMIKILFRRRNNG